MIIAKIIIWALVIVLTVLISGLYPTAALVVMALGLTFMFLLFKDVG